MKLLFIHADYFNYEVEEENDFVEQIGDDRRRGSMDNPLIAFVSIEEVDEESDFGSEELAGKAFEEIKKVNSNIKVENLTIFPFAHLSESLASQEFAISVINELKDEIENSDFNSLFVPFGWYKEFEFKSKGHPLSARSKTVRP